MSISAFSVVQIQVCLHPVCLYEWRITTAHLILAFMFKNILRPFEAEILKIFKELSSLTQKLEVLIKTRVYITFLTTIWLQSVAVKF